MHYLVLLIVKLIAHLPFRALYALSDLLYYPLYYIVRYRRRIVRRNLTESYPEKERKEILSIEKGFYHFLIDVILESCKMLTISPEEARRRMRFTNMEMLNDMVRQGKSVAAYIGHYSNWEWISFVGLWLTESAVCAQIYHKLKNQDIDRVMLQMRERMGNKSVEMHKTARYINQAAEAHQPLVIGFIADQSPRKRDAKHYLHFLNHNVPALVGTEKIAKHYGYEAIFLNIKRMKRGYYECEFIRLADAPAQLPDYELTNLYFQRLEEEINNQPELYLWSHKRFRLAR